jgi:flagellar hook-length control protein FliK
MAQHVMLKTEIAASPANSAGPNKALAADNAEVEPFSSELNKQIDKHAKTQDKGNEKVEQSTETDSAKQQDKPSKAEKVDSNNGKNLPKEADSGAKQNKAEPEVDGEVAVTTDVIVSGDDADSLTETDLTPVVENNKTEIINTVVTADKDIKPTVTAKTNESEAETTKQPTVKTQPTSIALTKVVNVELPETSKNSSVTQVLLDTRKNAEIKTQDKAAVDIDDTDVELSDKKINVKKPVVDVSQATTKQAQQQTVTAKAEQAVAALTLSKTQLQQQEVTAPSKNIAQNTVEGLSSDQKKQATALRPDILYGVNKKYSADNGNAGNAKLELPVTTTEKVMASERIATKALSEGTLMADIVKQVKPGLHHTAPTTDRGGLALGSTVSTYTPAGTVSQGPAAAATAPVLDIQPALQTTAWKRVMSGRVVWMAREGVQQAELKLNPASLGPVEVRLNMNNDQTSVTFIANHAATRDALEQALPRLRESFSENGMKLADAEVTQHSAEQQNQEDTAETDDGSTAQNEQAKVDSEEFSGEEQQAVDGQDELEAGLSLYA